MSFPSSDARPPAEAARALVEAGPVASRQCQAPGCGRALTGRQTTACSGKCRAALSRLKRDERQRAREYALADLLRETRQQADALARRITEAIG